MSDRQDMLLPSLGEVEHAELLEFSVQVGDEFVKDQVIALIESDKATLEVPAPRAGKVLELKVQVGAAVEEGVCLLQYEAIGAVPEPQPQPQKNQPQVPAAEQSTEVPAAKPASAPPPAKSPAKSTGPAAVSGEQARVYAGPAVRRLARQLGVALQQVPGTGRGGRVQLEDLHQWVRGQLEQRGGIEWPQTDWPDLEKYGPIERKPLERIRQISARRLHASWVNIPHVTQEDEAEVAALEALRSELKPQAEKRGTRLTPLPFLIQACVRALKDHPLFRSALQPDGKALVQRDYYHIGIAVDTPRGLLVPVLRDADTRDLYDIAAECARLAEAARGGKLRPAEMTGGVFTLSSLGHIGGTSFTPIINPPEVAILGISAMQNRPVPGPDGALEWARMLPLSLSYDHRVINGVQAVTFTRAIAGHLSNPTTLVECCHPSNDSP